MKVLLIMLLACGNIILEGFGEKPTEMDKHVINRAKIVCETQYKSCVSSIIKVEHNVYRVWCK